MRKAPPERGDGYRGMDQPQTSSTSLLFPGWVLYGFQLNVSVRLPEVFDVVFQAQPLARLLAWLESAQTIDPLISCPFDSLPS